MVIKELKQPSAVWDTYGAMQNEGNISKRTTRNLFTRDFVFGFLACFIFFAAIHCLTPALPIYLKRLGTNEREIGVLVGIIAIASLISRLFVGRAGMRFRFQRTAYRCR
jgi:hypothetical protein